MAESVVAACQYPSLERLNPPSHESPPQHYSVMEPRYIVFDLGSTLVRTPPAAERHSRRLQYFQSIHTKLLSLGFQSQYPLIAGLSPQDFAAGLTAHIGRLKGMTEDWPLRDSILQYLHLYADEKTGEKSDILSMCRLSMTIEDAISDESLVDVSGYEVWPDTIATLQQLKAAGYQVAVYVNTCNSLKARKILDATSLSPLLDYVFFSCEAQVQFPSREVNTVVLNSLGISEPELLYVGDMLDRTIRAAQTRNTKCVWLNLAPSHLERNRQALEHGGVAYPRSITSLSLLLEAIRYYDSGPAATRVGYFLASRKKRLLLGQKRCFRSSASVWYNAIDLLLDLHSQGNYDVIVHKAVDLYTEESAREALAAFREYVETHPKVCFIDSVKGMEACADRKTFLTTMREVLIAEQDRLPCVIRTPWHYELSSISPQSAPLVLHSMQEAGIAFPVLVKTFTSVNTPTAHVIHVVFDATGLETALSAYSEPVIVQEYINHDATVYKVYIFGETEHIKPRESSSNLQAAGDLHCIKFYSNQPWPDTLKSQSKPVVKGVNPAAVSYLTALLKRRFEVSMFGYDLLVPSNTTDVVIIDLNYFPGYKELSSLAEMMDGHVVATLAQFRSR